ncbi:hypothetical protein [Pseudomonas sp. 18173]|uniref:hypothetical protein n=1 Tax=Pseudomonas sp. 18173 TaxID=3390055 RepID=UPI003D1F7628
MFILAPLFLIEIWLIYMVHAYTEKAEALLPKSSFVEANRTAFWHAGLVGKAMRNGILTMVLMMPGPCAKRGIVDYTEARNFPAGFRRMLFVSWGMSWLFGIALMIFGVYLKYFE